MTSVDAQQLENIAHSLRGSAAILGAARLHETALALEEGARDGRVQHGSPLVHETVRELERVITFFADPSWRERLDVERAP
jgi:HPt (histidine-containing phosphotransfer) domain-containing protein